VKSAFYVEQRKSHYFTVTIVGSTGSSHISL